MLEPAGAGGRPLSPFDPSAARILLYTSGSTGAAKPVAKTAAMLEREAAAVELILGPGLRHPAWIQATVSHQHLYGLTFRLIWPLCTGRPFVGETHEYWESIFAEQMTGGVLVTSPAHLTRLTDIGRPQEQVFARVLSAGAPLPEIAAERARTVFGVPVTEIFGSTESGAMAWRSRTGGDLSWQPLPGVEVTRLPDGRMTLRSPFMVPDPADPEWHTSDDRIELDGTAGFRFLGRADRILKIEGNRVSLSEIETRLKALELVSDVAVVGLGGERPYLGGVVVPSDRGAPRLAELGAFRFGRLLRRALSTNCEPSSLPRKWRFVTDIPAGNLGKRRDAELVALFDAGETSAAPKRPTEPELRARREIDDGVELDLFIPTDLAQLEGHFPTLPVVAGVVLIDWVVKLAARHLAVAIEAAQSFQVKFRRITTPDLSVTLTLRRRRDRNQIVFEYRSGAEILSSGTIALAVS